MNGKTINIGQAFSLRIHTFLSFPHRNFDIIIFGEFNRFLVTHFNVANDANSRIGGENSFDASGGFGRAVGDDGLPGVKRIDLFF